MRRHEDKIRKPANQLSSPASGDLGTWPAILVTPTFEIDEVLRMGEEGAPANTLGIGRAVQLILKAAQQLGEDPARDLRRFAWVNESVENEMRKQHAPIAAKMLQEPFPIQVPAPGAQQVGNVRSIVPFPLHDKCLGPDDLLRRTEPDRYPKEFAFGGMVEPNLIHQPQTLPRSEDDIDKMLVREHFRQPLGVRKLGSVALGSELLQEARRIFETHEKIQVLRVADDTSVVTQGERSAHEKR